MKLILSFFVLLLTVVAFAQDANVPQPEIAIPMDLIGLVIAVVLGVNAFLYGFYNALGYIKEKTKWEGDNKLYDLLGKVLSFLQKAIEIIGPVSTVKKDPPK